MSRIGNNPVKVPPKVDVTIGAGEISIKGPLGTLSRRFGETVSVEKSGDTLVFKALNAEAGALHGTLRALVAGMVKGVTDGYEKKLTLVGVGYRAQAAGDKLNLSLGFSHPVVHKMPKGVKAETPVQTEIVIKGIDKQQVGQVAAEIRAYRPPEPYKGKGVRYSDERVDAQRDQEEVRGQAMNKKQARTRRARKTRIRIAEQRANRLVVSRSNCHIYAQIIAPTGDKVLASASTVEVDVRKDLKNGGNKSAAAAIGKRIADKAKALGIDAVAFDRSGYKYHGRVKALADAAREGGLKF